MKWNTRTHAAGVRTPALMLGALLFFCLPAAALEPVTIDESLAIKNINLNAEYFFDESRTVTINDLIGQRDKREYPWKKADRESMGLGYSNAAIWFRFAARNTSNREIEWLVQQNHFSMTRLNFYAIEGDTIASSVETGFEFRFDKRPFDDPTYIFPVKLKPGATGVYYIRFFNKMPTTIILRAISLKGLVQERNGITPFLWLMYGFFIVMIAYNLILFLSMRDKSYLYYTFFIASFIAYLMHYNGHLEQYVWGNFPLWAKNMGYFFIPLVVASVLQFIRYFSSLWELNRIHSRIFMVLSIINLIIAILSLFLNGIIYYGMLLVWVSVHSLIYGYCTIIYLSVAKKSRQARIILLSSTPLFAGAMVFALQALAVIPGTFITSHSILIGGAFQVVVLSLGLADKINIMKKEILKAEQKYRHIVESSAEIIFTLNRDLRILSVNNAVYKQLGYTVNEVVNKNFLDFIHDTWSERTAIARQLVEENISELYRRKTSIQFRAGFKTRYKIEPEDFSIKLQYTETDEAGYNILGKASPITDDALLPFLLSEHFIYSMDNYLINADLMALRLTRNLTRHVPLSDITALRIGVREIIINAIEHGNLGITFEEKSEALKKGDYLELIHRRQQDPILGGKKVIINYSLDNACVCYRISDEGEGFNHREVLDINPLDEKNRMLYNGRGIIVARTAFDSIEYSGRGNAVTLVKFFGARGDAPGAAAT
ncbi:MAG: ATP-binding protein [Spirochaetes bacterium]|nr:ATP-binding protein [Spirochaetota bacterium]